MRKFTSDNKLLKASSILAFFLLAVGFLFISVDFVALNKNFYKAQFIKNDTLAEADLTQPELDKALNSLINYFSGKSDELQVYVTFNGDTEPSAFYTEDELLHMHDVKLVFRGFKITAVLFLIIGAAGIILLSLFTVKKDILKILSAGAVWGCVALFVILAVLGVLILAFFDPVFNMFHKIFFPQGNWQFGWDSNMLAILPESLFMNAAVYIAVSGLSFTLLLLAAGITVKILYRKNILK